MAGAINTPAVAAFGWEVKTSWVAGPGVTVMPAVPIWPSLVAVMVVDPSDTPVTNPLPLTLATEGDPLDQVILRPGSWAPAASLGMAVS
jgi:hypothetical protein